MVIYGILLWYVIFWNMKVKIKLMIKMFLVLIMIRIFYIFNSCFGV